MVILGGGAIFAAWPYVYAVSFSGFYLAMFVVLASLILRLVGSKYRSKKPDRAWRARWDWALFVGGFVPALVFGVAVGNVLQGAPFRIDSDMRAFYEGSFFGLFTPFTLLCSLLSVAMLVLHGSAWLAIKLEHGPAHDRARRFGSVAAMLSILLFALGFLFVAYGTLGYRIVGVADPFGPSNPLRTTTEAARGAWLANYGTYPWMIVAPVLGFAGALLALLSIRQEREPLALAGSSLSALGIIATVGCSMFPYILPYSIDAHSSLTVWNASSTHKTLGIMLFVTAVFPPIVLAYTAWAYKVMFGRVVLTDAELCVFPCGPFERVLENHARMERLLLQRTLQAPSDARGRMLGLARRSAEEKVASFLLDMAARTGSTGCRAPADEPVTFDLPLARGQIADVLGLTIETVSRQMTKLKAAGVIRLPGGRAITISDSAALQQRAEVA